jgi:hypothetical protein
MKTTTTYSIPKKSITGFFNNIKFNSGLLSLVFVLFLAGDGFAATYYSKTGTAPNLTTSWNTNRDGTSGTAPANFTSGDIFVVQGTASAPGGTAHSLTTTAIWSISGASSKLWIEGGATLTASHQITLAAATTFQIDASGKYIHNNSTTSTSTTTFGGTESFAATSTFEFRNFETTVGAFGTCLAACTGSFPGTVNWNIQAGTTNYILHATASTTRTVAGNLTITQTGAANGGSVAACGNVSSPVFVVTGTTTLNGGKFYLGSTTIVSISPTLTLGDLTIANGATFDMTAAGSQTTTTLNLKGSLTNTGTGIFKSTNDPVNINFNGSGTTQIYNNSSSGYLATYLQTWTIASGAVVQLASHLTTGTSSSAVDQFTCSGTLIFGTGSTNGTNSFNVNISTGSSDSGDKFTLSSGGTLKITSTDGILASSSLGNIRVGWNNAGRIAMNAGGNYHYIGTAAQSTGTGLPASISGSLVINNTETLSASNTGVSLSQATSVSGTFTLTAGLLTTSTNSLTLTSAGSISGGSATSYVNGPFLIARSSLSLTPYPTFHVGKGGRYLPVTINSIASASSPTISIEAFSGDVAGTISASGFCYLSTTEYWNMIYSTSTTTDPNSIVLTAQRPEALGDLNILTSTAVVLTGASYGTAYVTRGGASIATYSLRNSTSLPATTQSASKLRLALGSTLPKPGTASATLSSVCSGSSTTVSVSGYSAGATIQWQESDDNGGSNPWATVVGGSNGTTATYTTANLTSIKYYRAAITGGPAGCSGTSYTASTSVSITAANTAGTASSSPTLCINTVLTNITHTTTGATGISNSGVSGGNSLPTGVSASWSGNVITISGTPSVSGTYNYSIPLTGGCGSINATGTIIVRTAFTSGEISATGQTICSGGTPSVIGSTTASSGGDGTITYSWRSSSDSYVAAISGATSSTYTPPSGLTSTTSYRRYANDGTCNTSATVSTGTWTVSVTANNTAGAASSTPTLTINTVLTNITHTTTGATGISNSGVSGANGLPAGVSAAWSSNTITISGTPTASGTFGYSIPLSGGCGSVNATGTITVTADCTTNTWTGTTSTAWATTTNWSCGIVATSDHDVVIPDVTNDPIISGDASVKSISVSSGGSLTVNSGYTLTVTNLVTVASGGSLTFENTAGLLQTSTGANSGNIVYKRTTTTLSNNYDFVYWGSPVASQTLGTIWMASNWADTFYYFNASGNSWAGANASTTMTPGVGYIARSRNGQPGTDYNSVSTTFTTGGTWTAKFYGVPNNGTVTVPVVHTASPYNLIGNPYPSAVDLTAFYSTNSSLLSANFYFWTHGSAINGNSYSASDYGIFNASLNASVGSIATNKYVAAGQGFFATASASGNVSFTNAHRLSSASSQNSYFYRPAKKDLSGSGLIESHKIWFNLVNSQTAFKQQLLAYAEGATTGYDANLDAVSLEGDPNFNFYSIITDKKLAIQSRPLPFDENDIVKLGYKTTTAGTFQIKIDRMDGMFVNLKCVYLEDKVLNVIHDLKLGSYSFTSASGTFNDRFVIRYKDGTTPATPLTKVQASQCGTTLAALNTAIIANSVTGATNYRFKVVNGASTQTIETVSSSFYLTSLTGGVLLSTAYTISVAIKINGVWGDYGDACTVTAPGPTTKVQATQCGMTLATLSTAIVANSITGATNYRFKVVNGTTTRYAETVSRWFYLKSLTGGGLYSTAYTISVATKYNGIWGEYGDACMVTTPGATTKVQATQCGKTLATLSTAIVANSITGATNYRFKVVNGTTTRYAETVSRWFYLKSLIGGGLYSTAYTISVAVKYNGVWGEYGDACIVTTPSAPLTRPVDLETENDLSTFSVTGHPNPYTNTFQLDITTQSSATVDVKVYDMIGKLIEVRNSGVAELGTMEIGDCYATGVYNVIVTQGTETRTVRMVKN